MGRFVVSVLLNHAEDIALLFGAVALSAGVGIAFGAAFGLIATGVLGIAYGVWISPKGR